MTIFGAKAVELISEKKFGQMVAFTGSQVTGVPLAEATGQLRTVPLDGGFVTAARSLAAAARIIQSTNEAEAKEKQRAMIDQPFEHP